jgi:hypothetical protein
MSNIISTFLAFILSTSFSYSKQPEIIAYFFPLESNEGNIIFYDDPYFVLIGSNQKIPQEDIKDNFYNEAMHVSMFDIEGNVMFFDTLYNKGTRHIPHEVVFNPDNTFSVFGSYEVVWGQGITSLFGGARLFKAVYDNKGRVSISYDSIADTPSRSISYKPIKYQNNLLSVFNDKAGKFPPTKMWVNLYDTDGNFLETKDLYYPEMKDPDSYYVFEVRSTTPFSDGYFVNASGLHVTDNYVDSSGSAIMRFDNNHNLVFEKYYLNARQFSSSYSDIKVRDELLYCINNGHLDIRDLNGNYVRSLFFNDQSMLSGEILCGDIIFVDDHILMGGARLTGSADEGDRDVYYSLYDSELNLIWEYVEPIPVINRSVSSLLEYNPGGYIASRGDIYGVEIEIFDNEVMGWTSVSETITGFSGIYPNVIQAGESMNIQSTEGTEITSISLVHNDGKTENIDYQQLGSDIQISTLQSMRSGVYFLLIETVTATTSFRFIVE